MTALTPPLRTMNAYILTGGKSARMARDKALLTLGGATFLEIIAGRLAALFDRVYTAGKKYETAAPLAGNIEDIVPSAGPLGGIHAALKGSDKECNFFVGVDYPLLEPELVLELARFTATGPRGPRGVVPVAPDGPHPLFSFYCRSSLPEIERCIDLGFLQVLCIAREGSVRFVRLPDEVPALEPERISRILTNVNRSTDYERLKKIEKKC